MKKSLQSRLRRGLFPKTPQSFVDKVRAALPREQTVSERQDEEEPFEQENPRLRFLPILATAALGVVVAACLLFVIVGAIRGRKSNSKQSDIHPAASIPASELPSASPAPVDPVQLAAPTEQTVVGTWELWKIDYNGLLISASAFTAEQMKLTFFADGTVTETELYLSSGETGAYTFDGHTVTFSGGSLYLADGETAVYDPEADTLTMHREKDGDFNLVFRREQPKEPEKRTAIGTWSYASGVDYAQRLTIRSDGTATMRTKSNLGAVDTSLTYTEEDGALLFRGELLSRMSARYDAETDTLTVTIGMESAVYKRAIPELAGSKWTLTGIELYGSTGSPETSGLEMYLEFTKDGDLTATIRFNDEVDREEYRYFVNGTSIDIKTSDDTIRRDAIVYDAVTDTLRMNVEDSHSSDFVVIGTLIFSRTPDAVIPALTTDTASDLAGMWTRTRSKYASQGTDYSWIDVDMESWQSWLEITADGHAHLTEYDSESGEALHADFSVAIGSGGIQTDWESCTGMWYDTAADTICMEIVGRRRDYYSRTPDAVIPEVQTTDGEIAATAKRNAIGIWKSGEGDTLWITDDGTARSEALSGLTGNLTYTVEDGTLHFSLTGTDFTFTARYDESKDTLLVTANENTKLYSRVTGSIAGKWTMTGIDLLAADFSAEKTGWKMYLEIFDDGSMIAVKITDDAAERTAYRLLHFDENTFTFQEDTGAVVTSSLPPWKIVYDAATDTLRMEYDFGINPTPVFSRTPDAVIPEGERREITALRSQYPAYFGLDTSKGLKVYVWQMSNDSYSCTLLKGSDNKTDAEIGGMKGTTIEEMRLILSTYDIEDNDIDVEVVPFRNPLSSYWYEIDKAYTDNLIWLLIQVSENDIVDKEVCDVDGDGRLETCELSYGPTSGLFTVEFTVYRNGAIVYHNTFNMEYGYLQFVCSDGKPWISHTVPQNDGMQLAKEYAITIEDGAIVLTDEQTGETVSYWGTADPQWNMAVVKTPEERLEGLWCAMSAEEGQDGLLEIGFYQDEKRGVRCASFYESGILYDGYTYTREEQESDRQDCSKSYLFTFANENGHERKLILYIRDHNEDEIDEDRTPWKDDSEQHTFDTFLKLTPITAEELPMKQDKYIFAGEGRVHYLDLVELNGDGEPVRVSVYGYTPVNVVTGEEGESELTVQIGACEWKINEKLVMDSGIYIDLDPNDGHGNLLLSTTRADGTERTYELHLEKNAETFGDRRDSFTLVCGHTVEGYCFLNDSEQQELMLATPSDLLSAKYGCREVKGEALEPVDEWLQASALIERIMFGKREDNIKDGTLLHLVRALPCEIDDKPATLEPGVYMHLREWHESMDRIVFLTEDDRWITVYLDGTAPYTVDGIPLADYFDNARKG